MLFRLCKPCKELGEHVQTILVAREQKKAYEPDSFKIVHVGEFYPPDGIHHRNNKQIAADNVLTLVFLNRSGKWMLAAGQNTVIDAKATRPKP
jgi:hypothetical protein